MIATSFVETPEPRRLGGMLAASGIALGIPFIGRLPQTAPGNDNRLVPLRLIIGSGDREPAHARCPAGLGPTRDRQCSR